MLPPGVEEYRGRFRGRVQIDGRRNRRVFPTAAAAALWVAEQKARAESAARGDATLEDAFDLVVRSPGLSDGTLGHYREQWRYLLSVFNADALLRSVQPAHLRNLVEVRCDEDGVSLGTVIKSLALLRRMFRLAIENGLVDETPFRRFRMPTHRARRMHDIPGNRIASILQFMRKPKDAAFGATANGGRRAAAIVATLFLTGLRRGELVRLRPENIDFEARVLRVRGKTADREIAIGDDLASALVDLLKGGVPSAAAVSKAFKRWKPQLVAAGLIRDEEQFSPHVMRHSAATEMVTAGAALADVQHILGHSTPDMTARYFHGRDPAARRALDCLGLSLDPRTRKSPMRLIASTRTASQG